MVRLWSSMVIGFDRDRYGASFLSLHVTVSRTRNVEASLTHSLSYGVELSR